MKVFKKAGSKERLLEMFENVNKTKIVEKNIVEGNNKETINEWGKLIKPSRVNESFDNPEEVDKKYLDKTTDTDVEQQTKYDDGVRYPVEDPLKVSDPSLEKLKGDDAPIVEVEPEISTPDELEGGQGDDASVSDFDSQQISKGIEVEMEHTNDPKIALEIVLDHLTEDPQYYGIEGENPELEAMDSAQDDADELEDNGEKEVLWGKLDTIGDMGNDEQLQDLDFVYEPKNVGEDFDFAGAEKEYYDKEENGELAEGKKKDPRLAKAGVEGFNKPKRTPNHPTKSHIVVAKEGDNVKTIRFGQQGVSGAGDNPKTKKDKKRKKSFKARHASNIKKGKMSAAYWSDRVKWIFLLLWTLC